MISTGLARLAAAGVTALTALASGLLATPAAAGTAPVAGTALAAGTAPAKPAVSVKTPTVSPQRYVGRCPATLTFSAKVRLKVRGKTTVAYRWVLSNGAKSAVKTTTVKGNGIKTVTL